MSAKTSSVVEAVCVWLDTHSEPGRPHWIVSHDRIEVPGGGAESSHTHSALDATEYTEAEAMAEGRALAERLGLPLYRNSEGRPAELVEMLPLRAGTHD